MRILLVSAAFACTFPAMAMAQTAPQVTRAGTLAQAYAFAQRCQLYTGNGAATLKMARDEALLQVQTLLPAQAQAAQKAVAAGEAAAATGPCTGDAANKRRFDVYGQVPEIDANLLLRLTALVAAESQQPYAYQLTTLGAYRSLITQRAVELEAQLDPAQLRPIMAGQMQQSASMLAIGCAARKSVRWIKGERPCPAIPPESAAHAPYAQMMIANAEAYALITFGPPLPRGTGQLVTNMQDNVLQPGEKFCRIQKTIGVASLNADTRRDGHVTFIITLNLPLATLKGSGMSADVAAMPARLTLSGDAKMSESERLVLRSIGGNFTGAKVSAANIYAGQIILADKRISLQVTATNTGTMLSNGLISPDMALEGFGLLAAKPQVNITTATGISAVATLPDLAAMLKAMDRASLVTAYQQCWP